MNGPSNRSLLLRLLAPYLLALIAIAVSLLLYSDRVVEHLYLQTLSETVLRQARLAGPLLPWDVRGDALDGACAKLAHEVGARVTVIAADGTVLGDSEARSDTLDNHRDRPEVEAALRDGDGQDVRESASVRRPLFYRAARQMRGNEQRIIRLALPLESIESARHRIRAAILMGILVAAIAALWPAVVLSRGLSDRVARLAAFSRRVAAGEVPPPFRAERDDFIGGLERNIVAMADSLTAELTTAREEKGKLEAVLRGMVEGVLVVDAGGTIRLSNQRAGELFGRAAGDSLVGRQLIDLSRDPDLLGLVRECLGRTSAAPLEREITAGHYGSLQVTAAPIADGHGAARLFILVFHDITRLKQLEATRRDFVANVSHELRTPLAAIRGFSETLLSGALEDRDNARRFLGIIERHAERLGRLVDDLLILSDLELGHAPLDRVPLPVAAAVEAAVEVLRAKAGQSGVVLEEAIDAPLPPVLADADRLQQILVNLIDNAIKYTPREGRVTVTARMTAAVADAGVAVPHARYVELVVADTGIGIPSPDLPRLTERFYRVDKARSRELGGTGLGLAIVKHLVQAHGGRLTIESEVNHGTTVRVCLPAAAEQMPV